MHKVLEGMILRKDEQQTQRHERLWVLCTQTLLWLLHTTSEAVAKETISGLLEVLSLLGFGHAYAAAACRHKMVTFTKHKNLNKMEALRWYIP